jgi:omega-6 fatty acid desaturase (delta-12 desaturase)
MLTNLSLLVFYGALIMLFGWQILFLVQIPVLAGAFIMGLWLYYMQHQYESTYWAYEKDWNLPAAAFYGSSYYTLHPILHWFTGNIGFHHIHHMCSMIPNYRLQECCEASKEFTETGRIGLIESAKCIRLALWDEDQGKMIAFRDLKAVAPQAPEVSMGDMDVPNPEEGAAVV